VGSGAGSVARVDSGSRAVAGVRVGSGAGSGARVGSGTGSRGTAGSGCRAVAGAMGNSIRASNVVSGVLQNSSSEPNSEKLISKQLSRTVHVFDLGAGS